LLASRGQVNYGLFAATLVGLSLVIASACVTNNYLDRGIDAKMSRTKKRALVVGAISSQQAIIYAAVLGLLGAGILAWFTNLLALWVAIFGFFAYVALYGLAKRHSVYGTEVGSISGAIPPVVGYVAVAGHFDAAALILFLILVTWQMPHFYAIAIFRRTDYAAAHIPVLPVKRGLRATKIRMLIYIVAFIVATHALTAFGYSSHAYMVIAALLGVIWLGLCVRGFWAKDDIKWARRMFAFSLVVITVLSVAIAFNTA
jgi:protoheme IX farnesyltransferase